MKPILKVAAILVCLVVIVGIVVGYILSEGLSARDQPRAVDGIRFTGMPAWATGTNHGTEDSWKLVHFIRHLPTLSADEISEMEGMNPRSPDEIRQELEEKRFLEGGDVPPVVPEHKHGGQHD